MTIQDILNIFSANADVLLTYYVALLVLALVGLLLVNEANFKSPITYVYTVLVYASAVPGLIAAILLLYNFFFLKKNLLELSLVTHYMPVLAMLLLLFIVNKTVTLKRVPGFQKLSGLFSTIGIALVLTYLVQKIFVGVFFVGSISMLIGVFIILLILLKLGWNRLVK